MSVASYIERGHVVTVTVDTAELPPLRATTSNRGLDPYHHHSHRIDAGNSERRRILPGVALPQEVEMRGNPPPALSSAPILPAGEMTHDLDDWLQKARGFFNLDDVRDQNQPRQTRLQLPGMKLPIPASSIAKLFATIKTKRSAPWPYTLTLEEQVCLAAVTKSFAVAFHTRSQVHLSSVRWQKCPTFSPDLATTQGLRCQLCYTSGQHLELIDVEDAPCIILCRDEQSAESAAHLCRKLVKQYDATFSPDGFVISVLNRSGRIEHIGLPPTGEPRGETLHDYLTRLGLENRRPSQNFPQIKEEDSRNLLLCDVHKHHLGLRSTVECPKFPMQSLILIINLNGYDTELLFSQTAKRMRAHVEKKREKEDKCTKYEFRELLVRGALRASVLCSYNANPEAFVDAKLIANMSGDYTNKRVFNFLK
ncbi:hypothetical protein QQS21_003242 [Conoideocrella luteorostrata]|uniref:Uncharacterized protein n=1 Tax=Conoideocrella luteorostrata TaxID=1105319 RepID=A0AAJ0CTJ0_9HYPO|nr:hypothetical protein QQS21_003242 [Conoideocrella luteorostrata]